MDLDSASKGKESAETINKRQNARLDKIDEKIELLEKKIKKINKLLG